MTVTELRSIVNNTTLDPHAEVMVRTWQATSFGGEFEKLERATGAGLDLGPFVIETAYPPKQERPD